jgi:hypothetical protein
MRIRTILTACTAALMLTGLTALPASAGTGASMTCSDGVGTEYVVDDTVVTLAIETDPGFLAICYSTAGTGTAGQVTGGRIALVTATTTSPLQTFDMLRCTPDYQFGIAPQCDVYGLALVDPTSAAVVTPYPNAVCAVYLNSTCALWIPGVKVVTGATSTPAIVVDTFGQTVQVFVPAQCVSVFVTCP